MFQISVNEEFPLFFPHSLLQLASRLKADRVPLPIDLYLALQDQGIDAKQYDSPPREDIDDPLLSLIESAA